MKQVADRRRSDREFEVGEKVYLRLRKPHFKAITQRPVSKLAPRYFGPFPILERVGKVAYRLQLPKGTHIHPVFHVSLLKKTAGSEQVNLAIPTIPKEASRMEEPKAILDRRVVYNQGIPLIQVLVKWQGGTTGSNTWECLPNLLKQFPRDASLLSIS